MPKVAKELSALEVKRLQHVGTHDRNITVAVGGVSGLLLQITPSGGRSWLLRAQVGAKRRSIGLGGYPDVGLAQARERAREAREKVWRGIDPVEERKAAKAALVAAARRGLTFSGALDRYAEEKVKEFRNVKYRDQWRATVENYAVPEIGNMLVGDIGLQDVLRVLQPIWEEKTETASKLRQRIERVLDYATVQGHREGPNPARWRGNLDMVLAAPSKLSGGANYPALQIDDAPRWWAALSRRDGLGAVALRFQALTATRTGAIRFATWSEIDLQARMWTIQPGRQSSKIAPNDRPKRIPLTDEMVHLLAGLPRLADNDLVFPAPRGGALSDATLGKTMRVVHDADIRAGGKGFVDAASGEQAVPHGLRSTFRTWVAERTRFDGDMAEIQLFHKVGTKVQQAYDRSDQVEKRRAMMAAWGRFLDGADVVELHGARA